jgi:hypothetical protein
MKFLVAALGFCVASNSIMLLYLNWKINRVKDDLDIACNIIAKTKKEKGTHNEL